MSRASDQSGDGVLGAASLRSEAWLSRWWFRHRSSVGSRGWRGLEGAVLAEGQAGHLGRDA